MVNSGRPRGGSGEWEQPFWQQRGWILSAGFLLVLVVLGGFTLLTQDGDGTPEASGSPSPGGSVERSTGGGDQGQDDRPAGCRTDDSDQAKPTSPPKDFSWKANGTGLVPVSKKAGPLKFDGPVWYCYAHTPMGAVLAAQAITDHFNYPGWRQVMERQVVPGPGRDALIASRSKEADKPVSGEADAGGYAGFTVLSYSKEQATVMILVRVNATAYGSGSVTVRWQDGDWKLVPDQDGSVYSGMSQVSGTDGFVTWKA